MDLAKVLQQLHEELANLDAAIVSLERLQEAGNRSGRPNDWLAEVDRRSRVKRKRKKASAKPLAGG